MAGEEGASSSDLESRARKLQVPGSHLLVDIMFAAGNSAAAGAGLVDPITGVVGGTLVQALGTGWALFNQRHVKEFLEGWLVLYVEHAAATDKLRSDVDQQREDLNQQREHLDEQRAGLDDAMDMVSELKGRLGDAAYATINHIVEVVRRTAHEEKLTALRNAALHVALGDGPEQALQDILLGMVDSLTVLHIRLLDSLFHPRKYDIDADDSRSFHLLGGGIGGAFKVIEEHVPGFKRRDILEHCISDLISQGLVFYQGDEQVRQAGFLNLLGNPLPTGLAIDFLIFINPPQEQAQTTPAEEQGS
jgi:hypothetical protein